MAFFDPQFPGTAKLNLRKDQFSVLLVDDSADDRLFVRRALRKNQSFTVIGELCDGEAAIAYLSGEGEFGDRNQFPFPDVLLLDLKMPRKNGHEVLEWLQFQKLDALRVVVLSGSFLPEDVTQSRKLGAHAYFKKEALHEEQEAMLANIENMLRSEFAAPVQDLAAS